MRLRVLDTADGGKSLLSVPRETFALVEAARILVSNVLMSSQPRHVGIGMAWRAHKEVDSKDTRTMMSLLLPVPGERGVVALPKPLAQEMRKYCKAYGIRMAVLVHHICKNFVVSLATKASLASSKDAALQMAAELIEVGEDTFSVKKNRSRTLDERRVEMEYRVARTQEKLRKKDKKLEREEMKHEAYMGRLEAELDKLGGVESFLDGNKIFRIHSMPLADYSESEMAMPRADNPWADYAGRLSRRGRGYQLVLYWQAETSGKVAEHPIDGREISWPVLPPGASFRVRDIWENIDWTATRLANN